MDGPPMLQHLLDGEGSHVTAVAAESAQSTSFGTTTPCGHAAAAAPGVGSMGSASAPSAAAGPRPAEEAVAFARPASAAGPCMQPLFAPLRKDGGVSRVLVHHLFLLGGAPAHFRQMSLSELSSSPFASFSVVEMGVRPSDPGPAAAHDSGPPPPPLSHSSSSFSTPTPSRASPPASAPLGAAAASAGDSGGVPAATTAWGQHGGRRHEGEELAEAARRLQNDDDSHFTSTVIINAEEDGPAAAVERTRLARKSCGPAAFVALWHPLATEDPVMRLQAFDAGANMVTYDAHQLSVALSRVAAQRGGGSVTCEVCGQHHLEPDDYWAHLPLYHIYHPNFAGTCQVCGAHAANMQVHVHEAHCPSGPFEELRMGIGSCVVIHRPHDNRFLMVQEFAGQGYWLPGGGLDPGETLRQCGLRESEEETGVQVELKGVLEVQTEQRATYVWRLVTFYATLKEGTPSQAAKSLPDFESAGACWVSAEELDKIKLRDEHLPRAWFARIAAGDVGPLAMELPAEVRHLFQDGVEL